MPRDKMEIVLWDMMRADKFLTDFIFSDSSIDKKTESIRLYKQVLTTHNTNQEEFKRSFDYYRSRPLLLKNIMDSLTRKSSDLAPSEKLGIPTLKETNEPAADTASKRFFRKRKQ
jgi:hypothetical protein